MKKLVVISLLQILVATMVGSWSSLVMRLSFFLCSTGIWDGVTTVVAKKCAQMRVNSRSKGPKTRKMHQGSIPERKIEKGMQIIHLSTRIPKKMLSNDPKMMNILGIYHLSSPYFWDNTSLYDLPRRNSI